MTDDNFKQRLQNQILEIQDNIRALEDKLRSEKRTLAVLEDTANLRLQEAYSGYFQSNAPKVFHVDGEQPKTGFMKFKVDECMNIHHEPGYDTWCRRLQGHAGRHTDNKISWT